MDISLKPLPDHWRGKSVLITGACGTVGRELVRQIASSSTDRVVGIDNNESELFFMEEAYKTKPHVSVYIGDICDRDTLEHYMRGIDVVIHAAAFKHVRLCERSPNATVAVNIQGVQNVIEAATAAGVERVLFTSSDKAVNPTNVMGTSKLMGERLMTAANLYRGEKGPIFASTRFGNVLGSRGSVIPLFRQQIAAGGPVTLTDERMTRFIMSLSDAVKLVIDSVFDARRAHRGSRESTDPGVRAAPRTRPRSRAGRADRCQAGREDVRRAPERRGKQKGPRARAVLRRHPGIWGQ
jgi:FlaA1/EpsC-like NDP-sugar epimerase